MTCWQAWALYMRTRFRFVSQFSRIKSFLRAPGNLQLCKNEGRERLEKTKGHEKWLVGQNREDGTHLEGMKQCQLLVTGLMYCTTLKRHWKVASLSQLERTHIRTFTMLTRHLLYVPQCQCLARSLFLPRHSLSQWDNILTWHSYHCYADATQLIISFPRLDTRVSARITACLADYSVPSTDFL